jgi:hypothetical protein
MRDRLSFSGLEETRRSRAEKSKGGRFAARFFAGRTACMLSPIAFFRVTFINAIASKALNWTDGGALRRRSSQTGPNHVMTAMIKG